MNKKKEPYLGSPKNKHKDANIDETFTSNKVDKATNKNHVVGEKDIVPAKLSRIGGGENDKKVNFGIYVIIFHYFWSSLLSIGDYGNYMFDTGRVDLIWTLDFSGSAVSFAQLIICSKLVTMMAIFIFAFRKISYFRLLSCLIILFHAIALTFLYLYSNILDSTLEPNAAKGLTHIIIALLICAYLTFSKRVKSVFGKNQATKS